MGTPSEIPPPGLLGGKLRLIQRIGRGGMGDVWMARNEATQAEVAVKTLARSERSETNDERFRREARLAATISHRNVVRIFDLVDDEDGTLGLVMELLRGGTLEACIRERGPLGTTQAMAVAVPILSALHHVHEKGIVHRDVKPANVFFAVEPDAHVIPKILDFGIAKLPAASSSLTVDGSVLGTPHYMSPEQIRGQDDLDGRSDMFSLAVLVYEMLTGVRVFQRDSAAASLAAVLEHEVDPDPRIEPRVWVAISRALAKRPYERFATCAELAEALKRATDATDEDFAAALQELRPRSDAIRDSDALSSASSPDASSSRSRSRKKPAPSRTLLWTLAAAGIAAILAVTVTLAVTRPGGATARADEAASLAPSAQSSTPAQGGVSPLASSSSSSSSSSSPSPGASAATSTAEPGAPLEMTPTPIAKAALPAASSRGSLGRSLPPPVGQTTTGAKLQKRPVATSPGF